MALMRRPLMAFISKSYQPLRFGPQIAAIRYTPFKDIAANRLRLLIPAID
jgi:hypothetical protein